MTEGQLSLTLMSGAGDLERFVYVCPTQGVVAMVGLRRAAPIDEQVRATLDMLEMDYPAHVIEVDAHGRTIRARQVTPPLKRHVPADRRWVMEYT
jgi:hypothetical protein